MPIERAGGRRSMDGCQQQITPSLFRVPGRSKGFICPPGNPLWCRQCRTGRAHSAQTSSMGR